LGGEEASFAFSDVLGYEQVPPLNNIVPVIPLRGTFVLSPKRLIFFLSIPKEGLFAFEEAHFIQFSSQLIVIFSQDYIEVV
jgi:hypothetical protein